MTTEELTYKQRGTDNYYPPLNYYTMEDGTAIGIYQGFRGENPDLDFIVKYREPGKETQNTVTHSLDCRPVGKGGIQQRIGTRFRLQYVGEV